MGLLGNLKGAKGDTGLVANYAVTALKSAANAPELVFIADSGKEGLFTYDATDTTTVDDNMNVLVKNDGKRFKRKSDLPFSRLPFVNSLTQLTAFNDVAICQFDNSTWEKKSGNVASNGGAFAGTILNINTSFYWERKTNNGINAKWFGYDPKLQTGNCETAIKNAITVAGLVGGAEAKKTDVIIDEGVWNYAGTTTIVVPSTVRIKGVSMSRASIYITSAVPITLFTFITGTEINYDNCIENLTIKNASATIAHTAIKLVDVSNISVKDLNIGSDANLGYFKGTAIDVNGRDQMSFEKLRIYADKPIVINPNPNHSISIDVTSFKDILLASPAVAGNKLIEIKSNVNLTNVNFEGYISLNGGQYGIYWDDTQTVGLSISLNIHNLRQEQEIAGGYTIYINHKAGLQNLNLENVSGGLSSGFLYVRNVLKVNMTNCLHFGGATSINAIANNLHYNISAINFLRNGTFNITGYNLTKFGNDTYFWTFTDRNILSNNVVTNSNGIGVNATPTPALPNVISTPLIGDATNGLMLGSTGAGTTNRSINLIFNDFVDANGTYNAVLVGERENIGADWQGSFRIKLNKLSAPNSNISTLTDVMVFNGRLNTVFLADKINSGFYSSATARTLSSPVGRLVFDASGNIGTMGTSEFVKKTTVEINAISTPIAGESYYNTTINLICFYNGTSWQRIASAAM